MEKTAEITLRLDVKFKDDGERDLFDQAADALKDQMPTEMVLQGLDFDIHNVQ